MCWLCLFVLVKGRRHQQPANPQLVDMDSFAAASLRSEYKPDSEFRKMLIGSRSCMEREELKSWI